MNKELMELIDVIIKPLEQFRFARKRIVAAVLAEAANELLNDGDYDVQANSIIRNLKHQEKLRRGQESWMLRNVADDLLSRLASEEDSSLLQSDAEGADTSLGSVPNLFRHYPDNEPV